MAGEIVRFHLDAELLTSVAEGRHNFLCKVAAVCEGAGLRVELVPNDPRTRAGCAALGGYDLFHMDEPTHDRALTVRRVYHYPFWAIEPTGRRWDWRVARAAFRGSSDRDAAARFYRQWRKRLFGEVVPVRAGYVYVPLQGRIRDHRSFQVCAPVEMIRAVLRHDPDRKVVATLHPNEDYDTADLAALEGTGREFGRFSVETGGMERHLAACDYVVTENSSAAFNGFFFGKPCVLFARIDFHHIAANVATLGEAGAFAEVAQMQPDYAGYIHWFWQEMAINAGRPEAEEKIAAALRRNDWPV
ncbi:MAG: hypothetical protein ACU0DK_01345 [Pseudooceanicola sp.]